MEDGKFEVGKEVGDVFYILSRAWDKEKILIPHSVMGTQNLLFVLRSWLDVKNILYFFTRLKLTIFLIFIFLINCLPRDKLQQIFHPLTA